MIEAEATFGHVGEAFYLTHCPMAFDFRGADWLQSHDVIDNPYFGAEMLRCGTVRESLPALVESP